MGASKPTIAVVIGANKGIGFGMFSTLLQRPNYTVIGTARNAKSLKELEDNTAAVQVGEGSRWHSFPLNLSQANAASAIEASFHACAPEVEAIDVLVFSAGYASTMKPVLETDAQDLLDCVQVNAVGPLQTVQGLWPLLSKSAAPKFVALTSTLGSIGAMEQLTSGGYGPSKAALNYIVKALHQQHKNLTAVALSPGFVQTSMGGVAAKDWGMAAGPPLKIEDSVRGCIKVIDEASRETWSGKLVDQQAGEVVW